MYFLLGEGEFIVVCFFYYQVHECLILRKFFFRFLMLQDSPMHIPAKRFLTIRAFGAPAVVASLALQGVFRGFKDTKTPVLCLGKCLYMCVCVCVCGCVCAHASK